MMKLSRCLSSSRLWTRLAIVLILSISSAANPVTAEIRIDSVLNGLFSPTEAERFFQEGRRKFEQEITILQSSQYSFSDDILQIDPELLKPQKYPSYFDSKDGDYLLSPDRAWQ